MYLHASSWCELSYKSSTRQVLYANCSSVSEVLHFSLSVSLQVHAQHQCSNSIHVNGDVSAECVYNCARVLAKLI
jgi:hypothetical protein